VPRPTPLFVLGTARSGTAWLANMLSSHPDVLGLAAAEHNGVLESHLLDHTRFALAGEWTPGAFYDRYAAEDCARLAGVPREEFCAEAPGRADAVAFFGVLMDLAARRAGARFWLEKTPRHAIYGDLLSRRFPTALFIIIERRFVDTVQSQLAAFPNPQAGWVRQRIEKVARYGSDSRALRRLARCVPARVATTTYEALARDTEGEMTRLLRFLALPERPLASRYPRRSSFGPDGASRPRLSLGERALLQTARALCALLPLSLMVRLRERRDRRGAGTFPKFRLLVPT